MIINEKYDNKKLWNVLNKMMGRKVKSIPAFIESDVFFITKPRDIANHLNNYFCDKINKLRVGMEQTENIKAEFLIRNSIMEEKNCNFSLIM